MPLEEESYTILAEFMDELGEAVKTDRDLVKLLMITLNHAYAAELYAAEIKELVKDIIGE